MELIFHMVSPKRVAVRAVQFDGSEAQAMSILEWMSETVQGGTNGHFRPNIGGAGGSIFVPLDGGRTGRIDQGGWIVQGWSGTLYLNSAQEFSESYDLADRREVVPCPHH